MSAALSEGPLAGHKSSGGAAPQQHQALMQPLQADCTCEAVRKEDLTCSICLDTLTDPFVTACGHTFCYSCLTQSLQHNKHCPSCSHYLTTDLIYPNFLLGKITKRARSRALGTPLSALELLQHALADHKAGLREEDVDVLLHRLWEHKQALQQAQREASMELLLHFLQSSRQDKVQRLAQLQQELRCLDGDIKRVEAAGASSAAVASPAMASEPSSADQQPRDGASAAVQQRPQCQQAYQQQQQQRQQQQIREQQHVAAASVAGAAPMETEGAASAGPALQPQPGTQAAAPAAVGAAAGLGTALEAAGAAAAAAVGQSALQQHLLFQQEQQALQQAQQVADFAGAAFASLAAQAMAASGASGSQPLHSFVMPAVPSAAARPYSHQAHMANHHPHHHQQQAQSHPDIASLFGGLLSPEATTTSGGTSSSGRAGGQRDVLSLLRNKKRRIATQFDDLQQCYMRLRARQLQAAAGGEGPAGGASGAELAPGGAVGPLIDEGLQEFSRLLSVITRCNKLKLVAEVLRPPVRHATSIISALEFDKEGALFATAGVSKRISIFEFASVAPLGAAPGLHTPVVELVSRSKLSCLSWNKYIQAQIASSDYEGVVSLWDVSASSLLLEYEAHSKRIWSVDFCEADPTLLASGSDDCAVRVWSTKSPSSVAQLDTKANVCTVRWRPGSAHELAVGSADHGVYLYDTRRTASPVATFRGHRKAVSYVRFCGAAELVSASTDSTLRLWDADAAAGGDEALRVFEGHTNEKNFVGLAVDGDFLACGSETSELFVYYKALSKPVAQQPFLVHGDEGALGPHQDKAFISAVCWRPGTQTLLAANSMGTVQVFSLTGSGQV